MTPEEQSKSDRLLKDYKDTFGTARGKRVLADLQRFCNVGLSLANVSDTDLRYVEGMRAVFWRCFHFLTHKKAPSTRTKTPPRVDFDVFQEQQRIGLQ